MKICPKNPKKRLNYDYNGDELVNLIIYVNGLSISEKMIQCKLKEKTRYVIERFKVKYSALMRLTTSENVTIEEINRQ